VLVRPIRPADRCPGVLRPWIADDGALVRVRLAGGRIGTATLRSLVDTAERFGDGTVLLTTRTNLQLRGIDHAGGEVPAALVDAIAEMGLLPSPSHERVRNIMVSPLTGLAGGRADLRAVATEVDRLLCADPDLADLSGRFLFVLDDGRGDVLDRPLDLGLVAVDHERAQLRVGSQGWGPMIGLDEAPAALVACAGRFLAIADGRWHVDELPERGAELIEGHVDRDPRTHVASSPAPHGIIKSDGRRIEHVAVPDGRLDRTLAEQVLQRAGSEVVVTPWRSLLLPDSPDLDSPNPDSPSLDSSP
jgi:precorrin-3B synthase